MEDIVAGVQPQGDGAGVVGGKVQQQGEHRGQPGFQWVGGGLFLSTTVNVTLVPIGEG